jgi:hypothetical protein
MNLEGSRLNETMLELERLTVSPRTEHKEAKEKKKEPPVEEPDDFMLFDIRNKG